MASASQYGVVKFSGQYRSEIQTYQGFAGWSCIAGIALFIIAAVAASGKFRGSNAVLGGTLIGATALTLSLMYVVPRMLGIKRNMANGFDMQGDAAGMKQRAKVWYAVAIAVLFGIAALGALAIKGSIPNQKAIGGIALGVLSGGVLSLWIAAAHFKTKYNISYNPHLKDQVQQEAQNAADLNSFQGPESKRLQQLMEKKINESAPGADVQLR